MNRKKKKFRILSFDGGGIRGVIGLMILKNLESALTKNSDLPNSLFENFDLISGTSTGGIIALGLACEKHFNKQVNEYIPGPYNATELLQLYQTEKKRIFCRKKDNVPRKIIANLVGFGAIFGILTGLKYFYGKLGRASSFWKFFRSFVKDPLYMDVKRLFHSNRQFSDRLEAVINPIIKKYLVLTAVERLGTGALFSCILDVLDIVGNGYKKIRRRSEMRRRLESTLKDSARKELYMNNSELNKEINLFVRLYKPVRRVGRSLFRSAIVGSVSLLILELIGIRNPGGVKGFVSGSVMGGIGGLLHGFVLGGFRRGLLDAISTGVVGAFMGFFFKGKNYLSATLTGITVGIWRSVWNNFLRPKKSLLQPKYPREPFDNVLKDYFSDCTISNCKTNVLITSYDMSNRNPVYFTRNNNENKDDELLKDLAAKTTAAPTFYPPKTKKVEKEKEECFVDGALAANNPSLISYSYAKSLGYDDSEIVIVSLGTGTFKPKLKKDRQNIGELEWVKDIVQIQVSSEMVHKILENIFTRKDEQKRKDFVERYIRSQPQFEFDIPMDDISIENIQILKEIGAKESEKVTKKIITLLLSDSVKKVKRKTM